MAYEPPSTRTALMDELCMEIAAAERAAAAGWRAIVEKWARCGLFTGLYLVKEGEIFYTCCTCQLHSIREHI